MIDVTAQVLADRNRHPSISVSPFMLVIYVFYSLLKFRVLVTRQLDFLLVEEGAARNPRDLE